MDRFSIRRARLRQLVKQFGSQAALAERIGRQPDYISRCLKEKGKGTKRIGEDLAEEIEQKTGMPSGWMSALEDGESSSWPFPFDRRHWDNLPAEERESIARQFKNMVLGAESELASKSVKRRIA